MNCYLCFKEANCASCPAFAICRRCGAGMCEKHLVEVKAAPVVGMGGSMYATTHPDLICWNCYRVVYLPTAVQQSREMRNAVDASRKGLPWWKYWYHRLLCRPQSILPDEKEAVAAVEHFLRHQRKL